MATKQTTQAPLPEGKVGQFVVVVPIYQGSGRWDGRWPWLEEAGDEPHNSGYPCQVFPADEILAGKAIWLGEPEAPLFKAPFLFDGEKYEATEGIVFTAEDLRELLRQITA